MSTQQILPQNGLRVGEQIVAEGDNLALGNDVGVKRNLTVGGSVFTNRVITPSVSKEHVGFAALVIDCNYTDHRILLRSNILGIQFINVPPAVQGTFRLKVYLIQDVLGNRTADFRPNQSSPSYPSLAWTDIGTSAGTPIYPVLQTVNGRVDVFEFITFDGGLNWVATQINPTVAIPNFNGTIVQTNQVLTTAFIDFSTVFYTDLITMPFSPKYKNSRLMLTAMLHHGTAAANDYSAHFLFTIGTIPIAGTNILSTAGETPVGLAALIPNNVAQNVHFGGYHNGVDAGTNNVWHPSGSISFFHGVDAGFGLDLRVRGRHADTWADRGLVLNRSWGAPNQQYTAYNTSSFTVMEFLP